MSDVKWIKIVTDIFDDEKILLIEAMPSADTIIVIWFKLLCLAGKQNNGGVLMINDRIAFNDVMLASVFRREQSVVNLALKTFEQFGMIEIIEDVITIPNWSRHQSLDKIEAKKEYDRNYQRKKREQAKLLIENRNDIVLTSNDNRSLEEDKEIDIDKDIKKEINKEKKEKHKYGQYKNVLLTDDQYEKLKSEYSDADNLIDFFDAQCEANGYTYKNYYQAIKNWGIKAYEKNKPRNNFTLDEMDVSKQAEEFDFEAVRKGWKNDREV